MAVTVNLGRVQPIYRGPYSPSFPYRPLDFVTFDGVTYYCIKSITGTAPPDTEFWVSILQLPLGIAAGGTGAITAEGARTALGTTSVGDAVFTAADAEAARGALGASSVGGGVFVAEDQAAARAALGATSVGGAVFTAEDPAAARAALDFANTLLAAISANPFLGKPLREPFPVWDHIDGGDLPDNSGTAKFIRLTANQAGAGEFNEGLLINEVVDGEAPRIEASAEITVGPLAGQRVELINTSKAFLRPGTTSGELIWDQMRAHSHTFRTESSGEGGNRRIIRNQNSSIANASGGDKYVSDGNQDLSSDPDGVDQTEFMGDEVYPTHLTATFYMRIS